MMTPEEMKRLASREFSAVLAADPVIRELRASLVDRKDAIPAAFDALLLTGGDDRIGNLPVLPLTAAKWAFLWILDNGFIQDRDPVTPEDVDTFLFVLSNPDLRKLALPLHAVPGAASGFAEVTGLSEEEVLREIRSVIRDAFRPLELVPWGGVPEEEPPKYDALWLTRICGIAAEGSGMKADEVCHDMPLAAVCCHFVNHLMAESVDPGKFQRDPDKETLAAMDARFDILADEFLKRKE